MLLNVSYNNPEIRRKIDAEVGPPYSLRERIKRRGIGLGRLVITDKSIQIHNLMVLDNNRDMCNIEMRPKGIIVGFRSLLESFALVIPYWKLNLYKGKAEEYSIYRDSYFIKIAAPARDKKIHKFIKQILDEKADQAPTSVEDIQNEKS